MANVKHQKLFADRIVQIMSTMKASFTMLLPTHRSKKRMVTIKVILLMKDPEKP